MTGPVEPSRPDEEPESSTPGGDAPTAAQPRPDPSRPTATGWGAPRPEQPRPEPSRPGPAGSWTSGATGQRPGPTSLPTPGSAYVPQRPVAPATTQPPGPTAPSTAPSSAPPSAPPSTAPTPPGPTASPPVSAPTRPPVPTGVPPRPTPLPPPRTTPPPAPSAAVAGSLSSTTVVPEKAARRPAPRPTGSSSTRGRRAKLAVKRLDPWSVFVTSLVLSLLLAVVTIVAAFILYALLSAMGVPDSINGSYHDLTKKSEILTRGKFLGVAALIAGANVLFLTALATIGSMLYNLVATFTGGLELTLSERD